MSMGARLFAHCGESGEKRPTGATPATLSCNCRLAGPVPLRPTRHFVPSSDHYLRPTREAIARWYRTIVPREGRIARSEWFDYTLVYS